MGQNTKVVLDTNILISALGWNGPEARLIRLILENSLTLCTSSVLLAEFLRVASYPKFQIETKESMEFVSRILDKALLIKPNTQINVIQSDPDDNRVLECAVTAKVDFIVSGDKHLIDLKEYLGIQILTTTAFLNVFN